MGSVENALTPLDPVIKFHQEGRLDAAEQAYCEILSAEPNHAGALHLLGGKTKVSDCTGL